MLRLLPPLIFAILVTSPLPVRAAPAPSEASAQIDQASLEQAIEKGLGRVSEFRFIRETAERIGTRVWLFGGTAAAYAHYAKWDLERNTGRRVLQGERFDYDYTNIYRSTQDLDIVIDGTPEQAARLEAELFTKYPHFLGAKARWEVRCLTQPRGEKEPLLANPNFLKQHTDSNSTGLIELTTPVGARVRDAMDWENRESAFLTDVRKGEIHFYFSPEHSTTSRYKQGLNPPIFSVIRALTKALQYELRIRPSDLEKLRELIAAFDPAQDLRESRSKDWVEKNAKKLVQNAVNVEFATKVLDELGLRQKLVAIKANPGQVGSLAWWLSKEAMPSRELGKSGRSARELFGDGEIVVSHETSDFLAYEAITRAHSGEPNVFVSRKESMGEAAIYGNGFYTKVGKSGARGTGMTIRFVLHPEAREGEDFTFVKEHSYVVVLNKRALQVIPETLNWGYLDYIHALRSGKAFDATNLALVEKLKRRLKARKADLAGPEAEELQKIFLEELRADATNFALLSELWPRFGHLATPNDLKLLGFNVLKHPENSRPLITQWLEHPSFLSQLPPGKEGEDFISMVLVKADSTVWEKLIRMMFSVPEVPFDRGKVLVEATELLRSAEFNKTSQRDEVLAALRDYPDLIGLVEAKKIVDETVGSQKYGSLFDPNELVSSKAWLGSPKLPDLLNHMLVKGTIYMQTAVSQKLRLDPTLLQHAAVHSVISEHIEPGLSPQAMIFETLFRLGSRSLQESQTSYAELLKQSQALIQELANLLHADSRTWRASEWESAMDRFLEFSELNHPKGRNARAIAAQASAQLLNHPEWRNHPKIWTWIDHAIRNVSNEKWAEMRGMGADHEVQAAVMNELLNVPGREGTREGMALLSKYFDQATGNLFARYFLQNSKWHVVPGLGRVYLRRIARGRGAIYVNFDHEGLFREMKPMIERDFSARPDAMLDTLIKAAEAGSTSMDPSAITLFLSIPFVSEHPRTVEWLGREFSSGGIHHVTSESERFLMNKMVEIVARAHALADAGHTLPREARERVLKGLRYYFQQITGNKATSQFHGAEPEKCARALARLEELLKKVEKEALISPQAACLTSALKP